MVFLISYSDLRRIPLQSAPRTMRAPSPRGPLLADPVERLVGRVVFCAMLISERRALFTASPFGKARATSGSRTTMLDDSFNRFAYFPRTRPPGKSERL